MNKRATHLLALFAILATNACSESDKLTDKVQKAESFASITETGELQAVNSKIVTVPFFNWDYGKAKLTWLEKEGTRVSKGDPVAQLDTSGVKRIKIQKLADLEIALADSKKLEAEQDSQTQNLIADLKSAEAAFRQAQIDSQRVRYESKGKQAISALKLQIAELELQKAHDKIKHTESIQGEELLIQLEKIKQMSSAINNAQRTIESFGLLAPSDGIVEYRRRGRWMGGEKIQIGDEFWPGGQLVGLPDLTKMKVQTSVIETDINKIQVGQKTLVRLDAYPKVAFEGTISSVSITCREKEEKSKIKVFDVEVLLKDADPILKPGMTVSCEFTLAKT